MASDKYITKSTLKERGWTERAIEQFYPVCDRLAPNPMFKKAAPMRLYDLSRVEETERSGPFQAFLQASTHRKKAAAKAVSTKKQRLLEELASWEIVIESRPLAQVRSEAIENYNSFNMYRFASKGNDRRFLDRITVNYLRHGLSNYEERLDRLFGRTGKIEAYLILRRKIMDAIASRYPELAEECERQVRQKEVDLDKNQEKYPERYQEKDQAEVSG